MLLNYKRAYLPDNGIVFRNNYPDLIKAALLALEPTNLNLATICEISRIVREKVRVDESNPQALKRWLEPLVKRLGVSVIVSDDLASFRIVAEKLALEHQICQFPVRRWVGRTLRTLKACIPKEWLWVLDEINGLLAELPQEGSLRLFELWKQIPEHAGKLSFWSCCAIY